MSDTRHAETRTDVMTALNVLALYGVVAVLAAAFWLQLVLGNLPCPLCLLQRVAFTMMAAGLILNILYGPRARNYGLILLAAAAGGIVSVRQILLHIAPGDAGYGAPVLGLHDYTWAALVFGAAIVAASVVLLFDKGLARDYTRRPVATLAWIPIILAVAITVLNAGSAVVECGFAVCPDNPVSYQLLQGL